MGTGRAACSGRCHGCDPRGVATEEKHKQAVCCSARPAPGGPANGRCLQSSRYSSLRVKGAAAAHTDTHPPARRQRGSQCTAPRGPTDAGRQAQKVLTGARACQGGCHGERREGAGQNGVGACTLLGGRAMGGPLWKMSSQIRAAGCLSRPREGAHGSARSDHGVRSGVGSGAVPAMGGGAWCACDRDVAPPSGGKGLLQDSAAGGAQRHSAGEMSQSQPTGSARFHGESNPAVASRWPVNNWWSVGSERLAAAGLESSA